MAPVETTEATATTEETTRDTSTTSSTEIEVPPALDLDVRFEGRLVAGEVASVMVEVAGAGTVPLADPVVAVLLPRELVLDTEAAGSGPGRPFTIVDALPDGETGPDPADAAAVVYDQSDDGTLRWTFAGWDLPAGASVTITFGVTVADGVAGDTEVVVIAAASGNDADLECTPDSADDGVAVDGQFGAGRFCTSQATTTVAQAASAAVPQVLQAQVDDWVALHDELADCSGDLSAPTEVELGGTISAADQQLDVDCVAVLDLAGFNLSVRNVVINPGQGLTITDGAPTDGTLTATASGTEFIAAIATSNATLIIDGGNVVATGGSRGAGIGGGLDSNGGTITIAGGVVFASGGSDGAGIGGGSGGVGGSIAISGGVVTATGGGQAAGIGGGWDRDGGTTTISGGTVTADGGSGGAGIGGGANGAGGSIEVSGGRVTANGGTGAAGIGGGVGGSGGGDVVIGVGATVTASGGHTAVGGGLGSSSFGSLQIDGTLLLPVGSLVIPDSSPSGPEIVIGATGVVAGDLDPDLGAVFEGDGQIANGGVIALIAELVLADGVAVTGHHYRLSFDTDGGTAIPDVTLFAPSFAAVDRDLPPDPTRGTDVFDGWTTQPDGGGEPFDADSPLPGSSGDGTPVAVTVHARWITAWIEIQTLLETCTGTIAAPTIVVLDTDVIGSGTPDPELRVNCVAEIDLAGFELDVRNVVIGMDQQLTIDDSAVDGTLTATSSIDRAGIRTTGATLIIEGGTVRATGAAFAAGIGGDGFGSGGTTSITGGTVVANGGAAAAGIGGGMNAGGGTVTVSGGTVVASAGPGTGAGIGGGGDRGGAGGDVVVGGGAVVTATGGRTAVGPGGSSSVFGSLRVEGVLRLPAGSLVIPNSSPAPEIVIVATGEVLGTAADPTVGAVFEGDGQIANGGAIVLSTDRVTGGGVTVTGHHYVVDFDTDGGNPIPDDVTVFASSFSAGHRVLPPDPSREPDDLFNGWTTEPAGGGEPFTADSILPGTSDGDAVGLTVHAWWLEDPSAVLGTCAGTTDEPTTLVLTGDVDLSASEVRVNCAAEIDLAGFDLRVHNIVIGDSQRLTIDDSAAVDGTLTAAGAELTAGIRTTGATLIIDGGNVAARGGSGGAAAIGGDLLGGSPSGGTVLINGGTVIAEGDSFGAGIGGGFGGDGGTVTINGGTVTAGGGTQAAGIGGGTRGSGSTTVITGGTVNAFGGHEAAAIGGGFDGDGGPVTITGGEVTARGAIAAAGIGGGLSGDGGVVQIGDGATVTASGGYSALGAGFSSPEFGSLYVGGLLRLPSGSLTIPDSSDGAEVLVAPTGEVVGTQDDPTTGAGFLGDGQILNFGAIALSADLVTGDGVTVRGHHHLVRTIGAVPLPAPVTLFASSFAAGHRSLPAVPARPGLFFQRWTIAPSRDAEPFDAGSTLPGTSTDGTAEQHFLFAWWDATPRPCVAGGELFDDVAASSGLCSWIEELGRREVTAGCTTATYCPDNSITRAQMAVFLLKAIEGLGYAPDACTGTMFTDVTSANPFCGWVEELAGRRITAGCGADRYCPNSPITRGQMAVFLLKAVEGDAYTPPACTGTVFDDVTAVNPFCGWIEELAERGVTAGCSAVSYCPNNPVTRAQMAVFLLRATN